MTNKNIMLNENQLKEQFQGIVDFLKIVHPSKSKDRSVALEIRPIVRGRHTDYFKHSRSLNLWNFNEDSLDYLKRFLALKNGVEACLYYSVFTFDTNKEVYRKDGRKYVKGKINKQNKVYAESIVIDFDNIDKTKAKDIDDYLVSKGLESSWVFTGHGFQAIIGLSEKIYNAEPIEKVVNKLYSEGLEPDLSCVDTARIMRLPYTFNNKAFSDEKLKHERSNPPYTSVLKATEKRFSLEYVYTALGIKEASEKPKTPSTKAVKNNSAKVGQERLEKVHIEYPYIEKEKLPAPILSLMTYTPEGVRNKALGFMVGFLKTAYNLSDLRIKDIMTIWAQKACSPAYPDDNFDFDINRFLYRGGLPWDQELSSFFGSYDKEDFAKIKKDNEISIPYEVLENIAKYKANVIPVYLAIKMLEHDKVLPTVKEISSYTGLSIRTIRRTIQSKYSSELFYRTTNNKASGASYIYRSNEFMNSSDGMYHMPYSTAFMMMKILNVTEIKTYMYMDYKFWTEEFFISQKKLGERIGISRTRMSEVLSDLEEKHFIDIDRTVSKQGVIHCVYTLKR